MVDFLQYGFVVAIVAGAAAYLIGLGLSLSRGTRTACGGGCSGCSKASLAEPGQGAGGLVQLEMSSTKQIAG